MISVRIEETAPVGFGHAAGVRGVVRFEYEGLRIQLVDLVWSALRTTPGEANPREVLVHWPDLAGASTERGRRRARLRLQASTREAFEVLPGSDAWSWDVAVRRGDELEARELVAEIELRLATLSRPSPPPEAAPPHVDSTPPERRRR